MEQFLKRTWAEIDMNAIEHNYLLIRNLINPKSKLMCVVKADAYGHGAEFLAKGYERLGADWFAVSNLEEALQLRRANISKPILILGYTPAELANKLAEYDISQTILSEKYALELSDYSKKYNVTTKVHIKIDSGMGRIGLIAQNDETIDSSIESIQRICNMSNLCKEGIFTHFAVADDGLDGKSTTINQLDNFSKVINKLKDINIEFPLCHCCNSGAIIDYPQVNFNMVRAGIILYGLYPSDKVAHNLKLKPAMQLKSVVSLIKTVKKGTPISYGQTFVTKRDTKIATVPIGYADGYLRAFSNNATMLVNGEYASVIGRVCMDQLMLDVTDIENVTEGSTVTVFGTENNKSISIDSLAEISNTINYELICLVGKRVPRIYLKDNEIIGQLNYIL